MSSDIIRNNIIFGNCYTGKDFENKTVDVLQWVGFNAKRVGGPNDGGIDVVANINIQGVEYSYYIQCKYYNHSLGKGPISEVYSGSIAYGHGETPVVITNNKVTFQARLYAERLGVEIIADAEWEKIKEAWNSKKVDEQYHGLMGIIVARRIKDLEYEQQAVMTEAKQIAPTLSDEKEFELQLLSDFDMAKELLKEKERLQRQANRYERMAFERQKKAVLAYMKYG